MMAGLTTILEEADDLIAEGNFWPMGACSGRVLSDLCKRSGGKPKQEQAAKKP